MFVARRMQKSIVTVTPSASLAEAQERMRGHNIRQIPVTSEDGKLVGILSDRDIRGAVLPAGLVTGFTAGEAEKFLRNTPVGKVMTRKVVTRFAPSPTGMLHIGGDAIQSAMRLSAQKASCVRYSVR